MIPVSVNHDHIRRMYYDAMAKQEHVQAVRFLRVLVIGAAVMLFAVIAIVAHFWR
jgi:hypothetical protein